MSIRTKRAAAAVLVCFQVWGCTSAPEMSASTDHWTVPRELYEAITCAGCDVDFRRVALPSQYELPTQDLSMCLKYVLDMKPETRDLLMSGWMECVELAPPESNSE